MDGFGIAPPYDELSSNVDIDRTQWQEAIITSPYLLESPAVIRRYCQARKNGWKTLLYTRCGRQWNTLHSWISIRKDIEEDSVPGFEMGRTMLGSRLNFSIMAEILN